MNFDTSEDSNVETFLPMTPEGDEQFEEILRRAMGSSLIHFFYTRLVGVSYPNSDGTSRQEVIATLAPGERLKMGLDEDNLVSDAAVLVSTYDGRGIGYLNSRLAEETCRRMMNKELWFPYLRSAGKHEGDNPIYGVVIVMIHAKRATSPG